MYRTAARGGGNTRASCSGGGGSGGGCVGDDRGGGSGSGGGGGGGSNSSNGSSRSSNSSGSSSGSRGRRRRRRRGLNSHEDLNSLTVMQRVDGVDHQLQESMPELGAGVENGGRGASLPPLGWLGARRVLRHGREDTS